MRELAKVLNKREYRNGLLLGGSAVIALLVITMAFQLTRASIEQTALSRLQKNLAQLLATITYDNDPATDVVMLSDPALGSNTAQQIYRAKSLGMPTGVVVSTIAPDAYNGIIKLLVGLSYEGRIVAVRVTSHQETPGLGDDIDITKSNWISSFDGLNPSEMKPFEWDVKKNGGRFDQFTGATITPRAVLQAVHRTSLWYLKNQDTIFQDSE